MHLLDGVVLGETHTALVGDVVDTALGLGVLAASSTYLQVVLASDLFQLCAVGGQLGDLDVHGCAYSRAQVGWTEGQEAKSVVVAERYPLLDVIDGCDQAAVHHAQVTAHLHGDDAKMIFFVAPDEEGLVLVVVDATAGWPEAASVGGLQEAVTLLEQEVVIDQLLLNVLAHSGQGEESALELAFQTRQGGGHL